MKIYTIKYIANDGRSWISGINEQRKENAIEFAKEQVEAWNDGTTFEILTFKQIEE